MSAVPLPLHLATRPTADRTIGLAGALITAYLAGTLWPMALYARASRHGAPLLAHLAVLVLAICLVSSTRPRFRPFRDLLPLALGPFLYVELRWLIPGVGRPHADALVQAWEHVVFPSNPAANWAPGMPSVALSELLHFAYASYYLLVLLPPILLIARGRREAYAATLLALAIVYGMCFAIYLVFPVDGPRFLVGPAQAPDGPLRELVLRLLAAGSSRGTAFPSSHVAASVVATLCALRFQPRAAAIIGPLTVGLTLGTVYGGFHYAVDALAGVLVGLASWWAGTLVCCTLSTPGEQSATAA